MERPAFASHLPPLPTPDEYTPQAPKTAPWKLVVGLVAITVLGGWLGVALGAWLRDEAPAATTALPELPAPPRPELGLAAKIGLGLGLLPVLLLVLATHEVGHLLGGWLAGFRFLLLIVGPLRLERTGNGLRLSLNRSLALAGGLAAALPTGSERLRQRTALMVAGGPLTSLLTGVPALLFSLPLSELQAKTGVLAAWGAHALLTFGFTSIGIALITLVPGKTSGFLTDGARLLQLLRGGPTAERDAALSALGAASQAGQRPRDRDGALLDQALALEDASPFTTFAHLLASARALDRDEPALAHRHLSQALALASALPPTVRPLLALEAAWFEAAVRGDAAAGRRWLAAAGEGVLVPPHSRQRALAAVLAGEGAHDEARAAAATARRLLADELDAGAARAQIDWLDRLVPPTRPAG
jgi:hypothetical protein